MTKTSCIRKDDNCIRSALDQQSLGGFYSTKSLKQQLVVGHVNTSLFLLLFMYPRVSTLRGSKHYRRNNKIKYRIAYL